MMPSFLLGRNEGGEKVRIVGEREVNKRGE
jgi:hypothetical protein